MMFKALQDLKLKLFYCFQSHHTPGNDEDLQEPRIRVSKKVMVVESREVKLTSVRRAKRPGKVRDPGPKTG